MSRFTLEHSDIPGLTVFTAQPICDQRGWFMRVMCASDYAALGIDAGAFVQENHSRSLPNVIRGLHTRAELREAKLVRVAHGQIFDVVVDLRPWSPTFLQWRGFILDDVEHRQVLVPAGCAHGFQALTQADVCYRVDAPYVPDLDVTIAWDDPDVAVGWPRPGAAVVSGRDRTAPALAELRGRFADWYGSGDAA